MRANASSASARKWFVRQAVHWLRPLYYEARRTRRKNVAVLVGHEAYLDASGTDAGQRVVAFAGFVSTPVKWVRFIRDWVDVLRRFEVDAFHMAPFFAAKGEFSQWSNDRRAEIVSALVRVMGDHIELAVGCGVRVADYNESLSDEFRQEVRSPEALCLSRCLNLIHSQTPGSERIAVTLDQDTPEREHNALHIHHRMRNAFGDDRFTSVQFSNHRTVMPLQAADILAHQAFQHLRDELPAHGKIRHMMRWVLEGVDQHVLTEFDATELRQMDELWRAGPPH